MSPSVGSASPAGPRAAGALVGLLLSWSAAATWGGLTLDARDYLVPAALLGLLVVATGVALRARRTPAAVVVLAQLLLGALALHTVWARAVDTSLVPRPSSVRALYAAMDQGAYVLATDVAPVDRFLPEVHLMLLGCALLLVWAVDAVAHGLRRPPLAGLPALAAVSVPVTVLFDPVPTWLFVTTAGAYVLLLACDRGERDAGVARVVPAPAGRGAGTATDGTPAWRARWGTGLETGVGAGQVAVVAVVLALLVAPFVPLADPVGPGSGGTGGGGGGVRVATQNPFISLRRDLLEQTNTSMVFARTDSTDTSYLRSVVLDSFSDDSWSTSPRELPSANVADGTFPAPPGLAAGTGGVESEWELRLHPVFRTRWLPLPSPLREVRVDGDWRYDDRFLDVALPAGEVAPEGLRYEATAFRPAVTAQALDRAVAPPASVLEPMTELPDEMPPQIGDTARAVVADAGARTPYQRAVALQDWFREGGGFEYSLEQRPGSGLQLLADFVTVDRVGYCEQFAAAMAAMGRTLGIPSRVAVGFLGPEQLPDGELRYSSDARHAWPEMYFSGVGWVRFEPTPSVRTGPSPDYTRQSLDEATPSAAPSASPTTPEQARERQSAQEQAADEGAGAGTGAWPALLVLAVLVAAAGALPSAVRARRRAARLSPDRPGGVDEGAWEELRAVALDGGLPWDDARSPREQAHALVRETPGATRDDAELLEDLLRRVERGRFARPTTGGVAVAERAAVDVLVVVERWTTLLDERARAGQGRLARLRCRLLPASVVVRR